jgi:hypothetical protein
MAFAYYNFNYIKFYAVKKNKCCIIYSSSIFDFYLKNVTDEFILTFQCQCLFRIEAF